MRTRIFDETFASVATWVQERDEPFIARDVFTELEMEETTCREALHRLAKRGMIKEVGQRPWDNKPGRGAKIFIKDKAKGKSVTRITPSKASKTTKPKGGKSKASGCATSRFHNRNGTHQTEKFASFMQAVEGRIDTALADFKKTLLTALKEDIEQIQPKEEILKELEEKTTRLVKLEPLERALQEYAATQPPPAANPN